jgi:hypothetical protein
LPAACLFRRVQAADLTLNGQPCERVAPFSFRCGGERIRADVVAGVWGPSAAGWIPCIASSWQIRSEVGTPEALAGICVE